MKRALNLAAFVGLACAVGCSQPGSSSTSGGSSSGGSSSGGTDPAALRDLYERFYQAQCAFDERCASQNGRAYPDAATCVSDNQALIELFLNEESGQVRILDASKIDACVAAFYPATGSCDQVTDLPVPCREAYSLAGTPLAEGAACPASGNSQCDFDLSCREMSGCYRCSRLGTAGQSCSYRSDCEQNLGCRNGQCALALARDASCTSSDECRGNLRCIGDTGSKVCTDRRTVGQTCDYDCQNHLACTGTPATCQAVNYLANNASCTRSDVAMTCRYTCSFASPTAATGTCGYDFDFTEGEPCGYLGTYGYCGGETLYADETRNGDTVTGCTCRLRKNSGESCTGYEQCRTSCVGYVPGSPPTPGTCAAPLANGSQCYSDTVCESGNCTDTGRCAPALSCN